MKIPLLFFLMITFLFQKAVSASETPSISIVIPGIQKTFTLTNLKSKLKQVTVTLNDPIYHQMKTYDGFPLKDVLALVGPIPDSSDELVFTALDGYAPTVSIKAALSHQAILTFAEHEKHGFSTVIQGKESLDPGPFYIVWTGKVEHEIPWPYQLASIEAVSFKQKFPKLYPAGALGDSKVMNGFLTFKSMCIRCHSINLEGGDLAPELNIPKNITEYWNPDALHAFIQDASSFRLKSKMPSFKDALNKESIDNIIKYLSWMKNHKELPKE